MVWASKVTQMKILYKENSNLPPKLLHCWVLDQVQVKWTTLSPKSLYPTAAVWCKTALNTGGVGGPGEGAGQPSYKIDRDVIFYACDTTEPIFNKFQELQKRGSATAPPIQPIFRVVSF